jgi:benzoate 4-monooxygenase
VALLSRKYYFSIWKIYSTYRICSDYYDAFAGPGHRSIFNTRSRDEHSRKRRSVAHIFSPKSARQFEQYVRSNITNLVSEWTKIGQKDSIAAKDGYNSFNVLPWLSYLAFDITGDLVFGAPFDMLSRAQDLVDERKTYDSDPTCVAAIGVLNRQGDISATLGCIPQLKPFSKYLPDPFFRIGSRAVDHMAGIAIERVSRRIKGGTIAESTRIDILAKLMESMNDRGEILGRDELMTEALTFLVAGSNSTAITLATMIHYVVSTPCVLKQLQAAIDEVVPAGISIPTYDMVKCVP